jgi:hypothetical protein
VAIALCAVLVVGSVLPGVAFASEADSEGEGTASPIEAPIAPDFDPGGEESSLEETPAAGGGEEEGGAVEVEPELDAVPAASAEVTGTADAAEPSPQPAEAPATVPTGAEPEPVEQTATSDDPAASEPVANRPLAAPQRAPGQPAQATSGQSEASEVAPPAAPSQEEAPSSRAPQQPPAATMPTDAGRSLAGKKFYIVQEGDCLWNIAAALLPADAGTVAIEGEVERLWQMNEARIGTGDPSVILVGTKLVLH